jgi:hypothetical protein
MMEALGMPGIAARYQERLGAAEGIGRRAQGFRFTISGLC